MAATRKKIIHKWKTTQEKKERKQHMQKKKRRKIAVFATIVLWKSGCGRFLLLLWLSSNNRPTWRWTVEESGNYDDEDDDHIPNTTIHFITLHWFVPLTAYSPSVGPFNLKLCLRTSANDRFKNKSPNTTKTINRQTEGGSRHTSNACHAGSSNEMV